MNTLDLDALTKFTKLKPFLELIRELDGKAILPRRIN